jgi:mannose-6-phosphate isomerase-like protein (cupin superfamily)
MKREKFILSSLLAIPAVSFAKFKNFIRPDKAFKVEAGKDRFDEEFSYKSNRYLLKVSGKDTDGDLCIFYTIRTKLGGPLAHLHYSQDEWFFVIKGEYVFHVGDQTYNLKQGDSLFGPRKVPHAFAQVNDGEGILMLTFQPAGAIEGFFAEARTLVNPTQEESQKLFKKYEMELVGPALQVK